MLGILGEVVAFPTVIFTGMLGLALLYWAVALLGVVDLDLLDGAADAIGGVADAAEGLSDAAEGVTGAARVGGGRSSVAQGPRLLGLGEVPMTISLTLLAGFGWLASFFGMRLVRGLELPEVVRDAPDSATGTAVLLLAFATGVAVTSVAIRPLRPVFRLVSAPSRASFVGKRCTIASGRVDETFGYADVDEDAANLRVEVRCRVPNALRAGSIARLESWDAEREVYRVVAEAPGTSSRPGR